MDTHTLTLPSITIASAWICRPSAGYKLPMPDTSDYHYDRAYLAFELHNYKLAESELKAQLAQDPGHPSALALLGACMVNTGRAKEAEKCAGDALVNMPDYAYAHYVMACARQAQGKTLEAEISIEEALKLSPDSPSYIVYLACLQPNHSKRALTLVKQALTLAPYHLGALKEYHRRLSDLGMKHDAEAVAVQMLALYPDDSTAHAQNAWMALEAPGKQDKALEHFQQALKLNPNQKELVDGLRQAEHDLRSPIAKLLKRVPRHFIWRLAAATMVLAVFFFAALGSKFSGPPMYLTIGLPLLFIFLYFLLWSIDWLYFYIGKLFRKHERDEFVTQVSQKSLAIAGGVALGGTLIYLDVQKKAGHPVFTWSLPHWLWDDWIKMHPVYGAMGPILFLLAVSVAVACPVYCLSFHIKKQPRTTQYFGAWLGFLWGLSMLGVFVIMAYTGPGIPVSLCIIVIMLVFYLISQNDRLRGIVKEIIRKDQTGS